METVFLVFSFLLGQHEGQSPTPSESAKLYADRNRSSSQVIIISLVFGIYSEFQIHSGHQVSRDIGWLECGREEKEVEEVFNNITDIATIIEYHFLSQNFQRALDKVKRGLLVSHHCGYCIRSEMTNIVKKKGKSTSSSLLFHQAPINRGCGKLIEIVSIQNRSKVNQGQIGKSNESCLKARRQKSLCD